MNLTALLGPLSDLPLLEGARCVNRWHLFDPPDSGESVVQVEARQFQALGYCQACPSLARCRDWFLELPANQRPSGVVAGIVNNPPKQKRWSPVREAV